MLAQSRRRVRCRCGQARRALRPLQVCAPVVDASMRAASGASVRESDNIVFAARARVRGPFGGGRGEGVAAESELALEEAQKKRTVRRCSL